MASSAPLPHHNQRIISHLCHILRTASSSNAQYVCVCVCVYNVHCCNNILYSITEINSTYQPNDNPNSNSEEDVLYQRGASFSAELDVNNNTILLDTNNNSNNNKHQDTIKSSENIANTNGVSQVDDNSKSDYDDDKGKFLAIIMCQRHVYHVLVCKGFGVLYTSILYIDDSISSLN